MTTDKDSENTIVKEVESWKGFEYTPRNPNGTLFNKILTESLEMKIMLLHSGPNVYSTLQSPFLWP